MVYIGVKKSKKVIISKNIFKQKKRKLIQIATVKKTLELIEHFEKLKNLEQQKKEVNIIEFKNKKKFKKSSYRKKKFYKKVK